MNRFLWLTIIGCLCVTVHCIGAEETEEDITLHEIYELFKRRSKKCDGSVFEQMNGTKKIKPDPIQEEIVAEVEKRETLEEKHRYLQSIASLTELYPQWLNLVPLSIIDSLPKPSKIDKSSDPQETTLKEMGSNE